MLKTLPLLKYFDLSAILKGYNFISFSINYDGGLNVLGLQEAPKYRTSNGSFVIPKVKNVQNFKVFFPQSNWAEMTLQSNWNYHFASMLNNQEVLLTCARAYGKEENAQLYDIGGNVVKEFYFGDGIQDIQIAKDGLIWGSYFDQGVFSDDGMGASGLNCWNQKGEKVYSFSPQNGLNYMADCYALNVINSDEVWFYYYTEFPLVRLKNKKEISYWNVPIRGAHAFSIFENYVLMSPGYNEKTFHLFKLGLDKKVKSCAEYQFIDDQGQILEFEAYKARGEFFYFLKKQKIYKLDLKELEDIYSY